MTAFASSDDAVDGYRHLEEYIFQTERNHDREIRQTIRLWNWQLMQMKSIKRNIGTNKVEVGVRAFSMGLSKIRDETKEAIDGMNKILYMSIQTTGNMHKNARGVGEFENRLASLDYDLNVDNKWQIGEPASFSFRDSELSEVQDSYVADLFLGPWIKRAILGIGLSQSKIATDRVTENGEMLIEDLDRITKEARDDAESTITNFITDNHTYWSENGIRRKNYNKLLQIKNEMETGKKQTVAFLLDDLEDSVK